MAEKLASTLTVVEKVYHRLIGENPTSTEISFSVPLKIHEPAYFQRQSVGPEWQQLDLGWFDDQRAGTVIIQNPKPFRPTLPSQEEVARDRERVIQVSYTQDPNESFEIIPGNNLRCSPTSASRLYIRCPAQASAFITVIPK